MSRDAVVKVKKRMYEQHLKNTGVMPKRKDLRNIEQRAESIAMRSDNKKVRK